MSTQSRRLSQVGCCVRAVVVRVMVDVSSSRFLLVEGRGEGRECGRRQMRMLNFGEQRETNLLIFFSEEDS